MDEMAGLEGQWTCLGGEVKFGFFVAGMGEFLG